MMITEDEFNAITGGGVMNEYVALVCGSTAIAWLATDDRAAVGVVRRDRDGEEISYSWGSYCGDRCSDYGSMLPSEGEALVQCMRQHDWRCPMIEFDQLVAEAVHRIGQLRVDIYLTNIAERTGWPIPPQDRFMVAAGLALLVQATEQGEGLPVREVDR